MQLPVRQLLLLWTAAADWIRLRVLPLLRLLLLQLRLLLQVAAAGYYQLLCLLLLPLLLLQLYLLRCTTQLCLLLQVAAAS